MMMTIGAGGTRLGGAGAVRMSVRRSGSAWTAIQSVLRMDTRRLSTTGTGNKKKNVVVVDGVRCALGGPQAWES